MKKGEKKVGKRVKSVCKWVKILKCQPDGLYFVAFASTTRMVDNLGLKRVANVWIVTVSRKGK